MSFSAVLRRAGIALLIAVGAVGAAHWVGMASPLRAFEGRSLDGRFLFRGPQPPVPNDVVVVFIEEDADLPYWSPIPRRHLADVIGNLGEARFVGLDILLDKPSADTEGDSLFIDALRQHGRVIAVSYLQDGVEHTPSPFFADALLDYGYATFPTGTDAQIVRRGMPWQRLAGGVSLSLAGSILAHDRGLDTGALRASADDPPLPAGPLLIDFSGPPSQLYRERDDLPQGITVCPSHLVAMGVYPPGFFAGKVVFVGTGLFDAPDRFRVPFFGAQYDYALMFGVEIHAHFFRTLSVESRLHAPSIFTITVGLTLTVAVVVLATFLAGTVWGTGLLCVTIVGLWAAAYALFAQQGVVLPLVVPSLALGIGFGACLSYYGLTEGRERRQTRQLFEKYLSPAVIAGLLEQPGQWALGGRRVEISVMFADLEGFTPLAEMLEPEELVALINQYLTEMTGIILEEGGTIDKYEGDLVMAFFGAPLALDDHAARACRAAMRMQFRLMELRGEWSQRGLPELQVRIGVSSGPAVVGNMGSDLRFDYTAMGDTVNLAARLEPANKEFGTYTLVSAETRMQAGPGFSFRALGETQVKGKSEPVRVYELTGAAATAGADALLEKGASG